MSTALVSCLPESKTNRITVASPNAPPRPRVAPRFNLKNYSHNPRFWAYAVGWLVTQHKGCQLSPKRMASAIYLWCSSFHYIMLACQKGEEQTKEFQRGVAFLEQYLMVLIWRYQRTRPSASVNCYTVYILLVLACKFVYDDSDFEANLFVSWFARWLNTGELDVHEVTKDESKEFQKEVRLFNQQLMSYFKALDYDLHVSAGPGKVRFEKVLHLVGEAYTNRKPPVYSQ